MIAAEDVHRTVNSVVDQLLGKRDKTLTGLLKVARGEVLRHPDNALQRIPEGVDDEHFAHRMDVLSSCHARLVVIDELVRRLEQHRTATWQVIEQDRARGIAYTWAPSTADELENDRGDDWHVEVDRP